MNLILSNEDLEFQKEVRNFINENLDETIKKKLEIGHHISKEEMLEWQNKLYEKGWMAPGWPKEYGGTGWR